MQYGPTITTRLLGATSTRSARIRATLYGGGDGAYRHLAIVIPYPRELDTNAAHIAAAQCLVDSLNAGRNAPGYTWALVPAYGPALEGTGYVFIARCA